MISRPKKQIGVGDYVATKKEREYVQQVLDTGRLSYGPFSKQLEKEFAAAHECEYCVLTNSGTSSLQIAVAALKEYYGWEDGDEVLCPATTFVATSNVILQNNLVPVFVDVEKDTYNLDPAQIEKHISERTKGMMVVHLYGQPADMDAILGVAKKHKLRIIEDSAETMFAKYKDKSVGSFGEISCFSTYACHIMASGVGGLTCTNNVELAVILRSLANHGRDNIYMSIDDDKEKTGEELKEIMNRRFNFIRMGYSYRVTEFEAALALAQFEDRVANISRRRAIAAQYFAGLKTWDEFIQLPYKKDDRDHSYMMFPVLIKKDAPFSREEITLFLEERMIETRPMVSVLDQPFYQKLFGKDIEKRYPVAEWINHYGFYIGCQPQITDEQIEYILGVFAEFFKKFE